MLYPENFAYENLGLQSFRTSWVVRGNYTAEGQGPKALRKSPVNMKLLRFFWACAADLYFKLPEYGHTVNDRLASLCFQAQKKASQWQQPLESAILTKTDFPLAALQGICAHCVHPTQRKSIALKT